MNTEKTVYFGLIKGRHALPVDGYIFDYIEDVRDCDYLFKVAVNKIQDYGLLNANVVVYVTGLTVATAAVIKAAIWADVNLTLMHYDTCTGDYYPQVINTVTYCPLCHAPMGDGWHCKNCGTT